MLGNVGQLKISEFKSSNENLPPVNGAELTAKCQNDGLEDIRLDALIGNDEIWYKRLGRQFEYLFVKAKL